jgi:rod shape-determining protein MreC
MIDRGIGRDHTLPVFITLAVIAFLIMTFDVRTQGGAVGITVRGAAQTLIGPLQELSSAVVEPLTDLTEGLTSVATLQAENRLLKEEVAELRAELAKVEEDKARLSVLEQVFGLELDVEAVRTAANVIGRPDALDAALVIDKGSSDGIRPGHPVIDPFGNLVGKVLAVSPDYATVVPITRDQDGITVLVGEQTGILSALASEEMTLEVFDARTPLVAGQPVVTSAESIGFPQGILVGEVIEDAPLEGTAASGRVRPFTNPEQLRVVVVITWPVDPASFEEAP